MVRFIVTVYCLRCGGVKGHMSATVADVVDIGQIYPFLSFPAPQSPSEGLCVSFCMAFLPFLETARHLLVFINHSLSVLSSHCHVLNLYLHSISMSQNT